MGPILYPPVTNGTRASQDMFAREQESQRNAWQNLQSLSTDFIGNASLTGEQQLALKAKSLCIPLLA